MAPTIEQHGFTIAKSVLPQTIRDEMIELLGPCPSAGRRGLLATDEIATLASSKPFLELLRPYIENEPRAVRAIYFDKSPETNWLVPWHQDLTIAVREKIDVPGFQPWSMKNEIPHVQPPAELLEKMLTLRVHLDDTDATNGALRVLPGTHRSGRLSVDQITELAASGTEFLCEVQAGDALLMRPLLVHASSRSASNRHRRILHIEYASFKLPGGLEWNENA